MQEESDRLGERSGGGCSIDDEERERTGRHSERGARTIQESTNPGRLIRGPGLTPFNGSLAG